MLIKAYNIKLQAAVIELITAASLPVHMPPTQRGAEGSHTPTRSHGGLPGERREDVTSARCIERLFLFHVKLFFFTTQVQTQIRVFVIETDTKNIGFSILYFSVSCFVNFSSLSSSLLFLSPPFFPPLSSRGTH